MAGLHPATSLDAPPVRAGVVYFFLDIESEHWRGAASERNLAFYFPAPFDPTQTKVQFMGIPEKA